MDLVTESGPDIARQLGNALLTVADDVVAGSRPVSVEAHGILNEESQRMFKCAVMDLRARIVRYLSRRV